MIKFNQNTETKDIHGSGHDYKLSASWKTKYSITEPKWVVDSSQHSKYSQNIIKCNNVMLTEFEKLIHIKQIHVRMIDPTRANEEEIKRPSSAL